MKTLHQIVSQFAKDETKVDISRRELAKIRSELRHSPSVRRTPLIRLMNTTPQRHEDKVRWPVRDTTFALEVERKVRDQVVTVHPMIENRKIQYPMPRVQGRRTR